VFFFVYFEYDYGEKNQCYRNITKQEVFREVDLAVWFFFFYLGFVMLISFVSKFSDTLSSFFFSNR
jgi:uncharacterized membrane protein (DUF485 family)